MTRAFFLTLPLLILTSCAGAMYEVPTVSNEELNRAYALINQGDRAIPPKRTHRQKEAILMRAFKRLQPAVQDICAQARDISCQFDVQYSEDDTINAYASDGRKIVFFSGLADILVSEDEYAAVLAHEMGHHISDHLGKARSNAMAGAMLGGLLGAAAEKATGEEGLAEAGMGLGTTAGILRYSKDHEQEADYISAYMLARAGYDLEVAQGLWARLAYSKGGAVKKKAGILDTHPSSPERIARWQRIIREIAMDADKLPNLKK